LFYIKYLEKTNLMQGEKKQYLLNTTFIVFIFLFYFIFMLQFQVTPVTNAAVQLNIDVITYNLEVKLQQIRHINLFNNIYKIHKYKVIV